MLLLAILITATSGCKKEEKEKDISLGNLETVQLLLWGAKEDEALLNKMIQTLSRTGKFSNYVCRTGRNCMQRYHFKRS